MEFTFKAWNSQIFVEAISMTSEQGELAIMKRQCHSLYGFDRSLDWFAHGIKWIKTRGNHFKLWLHKKNSAFKLFGFTFDTDYQWSFLFLPLPAYAGKNRTLKESSSSTGCKKGWKGFSEKHNWTKSRLETLFTLFSFICLSVFSGESLNFVWESRTVVNIKPFSFETRERPDLSIQVDVISRMTRDFFSILWA